MSAFGEQCHCGAVHEDSEDRTPALCTYPAGHGLVGPGDEPARGKPSGLRRARAQRAPATMEHGAPEGGVWWTHERAVVGVTERGFAIWRFENTDYDSEKPYTVTVQQSSLAFEHKVWVGPDGGRRMHLDVVRARMLRDALTDWLGDQPYEYDAGWRERTGAFRNGGEWGAREQAQEVLDDILQGGFETADEPTSESFLVRRRAAGPIERAV